MRKIIIILLLHFWVSANVAHAYLLNLGPRFGVNHTKIPSDMSALAESDNGYHVGAFGRCDFILCYVQPELIFSATGVKIKNQADSKLAQIDFKKLDIPIIVGVPFLGPVRVQGGPVFSILLDAIKDKEDIKNNYHQKVTVGWQAGLGIDLFNTTISLKYEGNLRLFGDKIADFNTDQRHAQWLVSIGFLVL